MLGYLLDFLRGLFTWMGTACILVCVVWGELFLVRMLNAGDLIGLVLALCFGLIDCGILFSGMMLAAR